MSGLKTGEYIRTFNRYELKYLIHYEKARILEDMIRPHVKGDPHQGRDGFYKIVSLYYDSPDLACYWEKMDGEKYRRKVRLRTYDETPTDAFLEIKQRYNLNVQKRRIRAPLEEVTAAMERICSGRYGATADPVYDEVCVLCRRYALEPKLIVSYNRAAYFDRYKRDLRITFDRNIRCRSLSLDLTKDRTVGRYAIPPALLILEVKFNEVIPRWLCACLNALDLVGQRISKYCYGIESSGLQLRT